jgi:hypothetical protein
MGNFIMAYPKWFPYPKAWLKSIELLIYNIPVLVAMRIIGTWYILGASLITDQDKGSIFLGIGLIFLPFVVMWLGFAYLYQLFWGKVRVNPKWLEWFPSNSSLWNGFLMMVFSVCGWLSGLLIIFPFVVEQSNYREPYLSDTLVSIATTVWIVSVAYCFHAKILINKFNKKDGKFSE